MLMNRTTPFMVPVDDANPAIIKNEALCSECGHCFAVCEEEIGEAKYLLNQREAYQCSWLFSKAVRKTKGRLINVLAVDSVVHPVRKKQL